MKRLITFLVFLLLVNLCIYYIYTKRNTESFTDDQFVTVYSGTTYTGQSQNIFSGQSVSQKDGTLRADLIRKIRSIKVPPGFLATVWSSEGGNSTGIARNIWDLGFYTGWNGKDNRGRDLSWDNCIVRVTVIKITKVQIFRDSYFKNVRVELNVPPPVEGSKVSYELPRVGLNDDINSLLIPANYRVTLYEHPNAEDPSKRGLSTTYFDICWSDIGLNMGGYCEDTSLPVDTRLTKTRFGAQNWGDRASSVLIEYIPPPPPPPPKVETKTVTTITPPPSPPSPPTPVVITLVNPLDTALQNSTYKMSDVINSSAYVPFSLLPPSGISKTSNEGTVESCKRSCLIDSLDPSVSKVESSLTDKLCMYATYTNSNKECKKYYGKRDAKAETSLINQPIPTGWDQITFLAKK
jgi:hypothetical protein